MSCHHTKQEMTKCLGESKNTVSIGLIHSYILGMSLQVIDFERDFEQLKLGEKTEKDIPYCNVLGLKKDLTGAEVSAEIAFASEENSDSERESSEGGLFTLWLRFLMYNHSCPAL